MSVLDPKQAIWKGWYFEGEYLIDDCGNKYHPLVIKACNYARQMKDPQKILWHRPQWDD